MKKQRLLLILLFICVSPVVIAGPVNVMPSATQAPESQWGFTLAPYGWLPGMTGSISIADRTADVDVSPGEVLSHLDAAFMMVTQVRYNRWAVTGDLVYARLHDDIDPPNGILFSSTHEVLKETIGTIDLSYRVVDSPKAFLSVYAGARIYDIYTQIVLRPRLAQGVNVSTTETWVDPIIGIRGRYYVSRAVFLNLCGDIGGFGAGSEFSWQALGGVGVQVSRWCDLELGYRALGFDYEPGRTKQDLISHGVITGAVVHF